MTRNKNRKIIQVPMDGQQRLHRFEAKERDLLHRQGYQRYPEDLDWATSSAKLLSKRLPKDSKWEDRKLKPGDVLTIKVITTARVDEPRRRVVEDPELVERSQRRYYQRLKRKFEKPRKK
jgi:hypothetical protein